MKLNNGYIFICAWLPHVAFLNMHTFTFAMVVSVAIIGDFIRKDIGRTL